MGGLRSDYLALVEKRNLAALSTIKSSRALAEKLLAKDPSYYDAYLAIGVENYLLSVNSAPVRWLLRIGGARTDKQEGPRIFGSPPKGRYLAPYVRVYWRSPRCATTTAMGRVLCSAAWLRISQTSPVSTRTRSHRAVIG